MSFNDINNDKILNEWTFLEDHENTKQPASSNWLSSLVYGALETLNPRKMTQLQKTYLVMTECIKTLPGKGAATTEGVFRISGEVKRSNAWLKEIQTAPNLTAETVQNLFKQRDVSVHDIARLIPKVLGDLPEGFFFSLDNLNALQGASDDVTKLIVNTFPAQKRELLKTLLLFLNQFAQNATTTQMGSSNLARIFGPSLFKLPLNLTTHANAGKANEVTQKLIENAPALFA